MNTAFGFLLRHTLLLIVLVYIVIGYLFRHEIFGLAAESQQLTATQDDQAEQAGRPVSDAATATTTPDHSINESNTGLTAAGVPGQGVHVYPHRTVDAAVPMHDSGANETLTAPATGANETVHAAGSTIADAEEITRTENTPDATTNWTANGDNALPSADEQLLPVPEQQIDLDAVRRTPGIFRSTDNGTEGQLVGKQQDMLNSARQALWQGDAAKAEQIYQQVTVMFPQEPAVFGETGDFYYETGKREQAARAYYQAGELFAAEGNIQGASRMVDVLRNQLEQPAMAELLETKYLRYAPEPERKGD